MREREEHQAVPLDYSTRPVGAVPRYRTIFAGILIVGGVVAGVAGLFARHEAARGNICLTGCGLVVYGLLIRYQQVRS